MCPNSSRPGRRQLRRKFRPINTFPRRKKTVEVNYSADPPPDFYLAPQHKML
jgi:hypothetical protein